MHKVFQTTLHHFSTDPTVVFKYCFFKSYSFIMVLSSVTLHYQYVVLSTLSLFHTYLHEIFLAQPMTCWFSPIPCFTSLKTISLPWTEPAIIASIATHFISVSGVWQSSIPFYGTLCFQRIYLVWNGMILHQRNLFTSQSLAHELSWKWCNSHRGNKYGTEIIMIHE